MAGPPLQVTFHMRGKEVAMRNFERMRKQLVKRAGSSAYNAALHLKAQSQKVVPYLTGNLHDSAYVAKVTDMYDKVVWGMGYDHNKAPYDYIVHEVPGRTHPIRGPHPEAKQDHFLTEPAEQMKKEYPRTVKDDLQDEIKRVKIERLPK